jgi:Flp pilus assembly protein TadD
VNESREVAARALLDQAMQLHQQGKLEQAANFYAEHLKQAPNDAQSLRLYGILARDSGDEQLSLSLLIRLAKLQPENAAAFDEIALAYMAAGLLDDAAEALQHSLQLKPDNLRALTNQGALLHFRGHAEQAVHVYREALSLEPDDLEIRCNLAKALADANDPSTALRECEIAIKSSDEHPLAISVKATILADTGQHSEAVELFETLRELASYDESILINLGFSYQQLGNPDAALSAWREAVDINPHNARATSDLTYALIAKGDAQLARKLCEGFLLRHPGEPLILAALSYAAAAAQHGIAAELFDYANLVQTISIRCPDGFADVSSFDQTLKDVILGDSSLIAEPLNKATSGGSQTGELDLAASPAVVALKSIIQEAIQQYCETLIATGLLQHQALTRRTEAFGLRAWGTLLNAGGRQTPHIHPTAWISGVYYVAVPAGLENHEGCIEFGLPPERIDITRHLPANFPTHRIQPVAGTLILFPSYLYHQTLPFTANEPRISIAFDAVPFSSMAMF